MLGEAVIVASSSVYLLKGLGDGLGGHGRFSSELPVVPVLAFNKFEVFFRLLRRRGVVVQVAGDGTFW